MGLTDVGVVFKAEDINNFLASLGKASEELIKFSNFSNNAKVSMFNFSKKVETSTLVTQKFINVAKNVDKLVGPFEKLSKSASSSNNILMKFSGTLGSTIIDAAKVGGTIGGAIGAIASAIPALATAISTLPIAGLPGGAIEVIGTLTGAIIGAGGAAYFAITKAFIQLGADIVSSIGGFFGKIASSVLKFMGTAIEAIYRAGVSIANAVIGMVRKIYDSLKSVVGKITDAIKGLFDTFFGMFTGGATPGRGGWRSLSSSIFGAMLKFEVLKQVIRGVINEVKSFAKAAFQGAVDLQTMTIRLDNLIAAQIRGIGLTDSYSASINMAGKYTQGLLEWSQKLALATPVSLEDITRTVSLSIAMGWTVEAAKEMTKSIIDYTSATGLGSEVTERIIYNFAQMKQQGKVTGTELRDLGRGAFMPINDILEIMYNDLGDVNMSFEDFKTKAAEGSVAVEGFFTAFNEYVAKNMPDAAYRMNFTFAAVMNNLRDLFQVLLGWNVFGPMIKSITEPLQNLITKLSSADVLAKFNAIGKALAYLIESIRWAVGELGGQALRAFKAMGLGLPSFENVIKTIIKFGLAIREVGNIIGQFIYHIVRPFLGEVGDKIGGTFEGLSTDAFKWGTDLIFNFATGMLKAASSVLTKVINYIANLLTSWFIVHSPPKILPDIDKWGADTINEWLHGFTKADFTILEDMKGMIEKVFGAMVNMGAITDVESTQLSTQYTVRMIEALDEFNRTGQISAGVFEDLRNIGGIFGTELAELMSLEMDYIKALKQKELLEKAVADATKIAEQAQIDYDNAVRASQQSEIKTNKLIREYNAMLRKGADKATLKSKLKIINASEMELDANRKAEQVKKSELDIAKKQQDAAEKALSAYEETMKAVENSLENQRNIISTLADLYKKQDEATDKMAGSAEDLAEAIEDASDALSQLGTPAGGKGIDFEALFKEAQAEFDKQVNRLKGKWGDFVDENFGPLSPLRKALSNIWDVLTTAWETKIGPTLKRLWDDFASYVHLPSWDEILSAWENPPNYKPPPTGVALGPNGEDVSLTTKPTLASRFASILEAFKKDFEGMGTFARIGQWILDKLIEGFNAATAPTGFLNDILDKLFGAEAGLTTQEGKKGSKEFVENVGFGARIFNIIVEQLTLGWQKYGPQIMGFMKGVGVVLIDSLFKGALDWLKGKVVTFCYNAFGPESYLTKAIFGIFGIGSPSTVFEGYGHDLIQGLYNGIVEWIETKWEEVKQGFQNFIDKVKLFFGISEGTDAQSFKDIASSLISGLYNGITSFVTSKWEDAKAGFDDFIQFVKDILGYGKENSEENPFYLIGKAIINAIINGINFVKGQISTIVDEIVGSIWSILPWWLKKWINGTLPKNEGETGTKSGSKPEKEHVDKGERDYPPGSYANGGFVKAWQAHLVGEKGPELFIPNINGFVIPNNITSALATLTRVFSPVSATPVLRETVVNFGDVHINNSMDWAVFKSRVQRAITEG